MENENEKLFKNDKQNRIKPYYNHNNHKNNRNKSEKKLFSTSAEMNNECEQKQNNTHTHNMQFGVACVFCMVDSVLAA